MNAHYLAGLFSRKDELRGYADRMKALDIPVTSSWLYDNTDNGPISDYRCEAAQIIAAQDLHDLDRSDAVILFTQERGPWPGGGRFIEFGYGMALGKALAIVGPVENIFLGLDAITHYDTVDELFEDFGE